MNIIVNEEKVVIKKTINKIEISEKYFNKVLDKNEIYTHIDFDETIRLLTEVSPLIKPSDEEFGMGMKKLSEFIKGGNNE